MISVNVHIEIIMMIHLAGGCQTKMFSYVWKTRFVDQDVSEALKYFIIILFHHTFYLFKKNAASAIWILHMLQSR